MRPKSWIKVFALSATVLMLIAAVVSCGTSPAPSQPSSKPAGKAEEAAPAKSEVKPAEKSEAKPAAKTEEKAAAKAEEKPAAKIEAKPAAKAEVKPLDPPVTVKVADVGALPGAPIYIAEERGYFKEEGIKLERESVGANMDLMAPLSAGQIHVAGGTMGAGFVNSVARGIKVKFVSDTASVGKGTGFIGLIARKDLVDSGQLKSYADLKGKKIAIAGKGSGTEILAHLAAEKGGLTAKDFEIVEIANPDQVAALSNKAIDLAVMPEPLASLAIARGFALRWRPADDIRGEFMLGGQMYSPVFMERNPEAAKRYMVALIRGIRDYHDAFIAKKTDKKDLIAILTQRTIAKDPALWDNMISHYVNPDGYANIKSLAEDQDFYVARGYIKEPVDVKALYDNQYVDYALQRLGKYQR